MSMLKRRVVNVGLGRTFEGTILDVVGNRCTVRLARNGTILRGITYVGPQPEIGNRCLVDYASGKPIAQIYGKATVEASTRRPIENSGTPKTEFPITTTPEGWGSTAGASSFLELSDVDETTYIGYGGQSVRVNIAENALEFSTGTPSTQVFGGVVLLDQTAPVGGQASFDLNPIPGSQYSHIEIVLYGKMESSSLKGEGIVISFNGDTTDANYRRAWQFGSNYDHGAAAGNDRYLGFLPNVAATNTYAIGQMRIIIPDPQSTTHMKIAQCVNSNRYESDNAQVLQVGTAWESAAAITRITLAGVTGDFGVGTRCVMVGYKNIEVAGSDGSAFAHLTPGTDTRNIIQPSGDYIALTTKGYSGQTKDLKQYLKSDNTLYSGVNSIGGRYGKLAVATKTATYNAAVTDNVIVCNKATAMTVNLPAATGSGQELTIKSIGAGAVTIDGNASETIDGNATQIIYQWEAVTIIDYASGAWVIV